MSDALQDLIVHLEATTKNVRELEQQAHTALYVQNDSDAHRRHMLAKANLLQNLPGEYSSLLTACSVTYPQQAATAKRAIDGFSRSAAGALELNSIFYMSALLYPDDHKEGEPNNLERLIAELKGTPYKKDPLQGRSPF